MKSAKVSIDPSPNELFIRKYALSGTK